MTHKTLPPHAGLPKSLYDEALPYLQEMTEEDVKLRLVIPYFERQGWICSNVDRRHEDEHCCDVLLTLPNRESEILAGIQIKARKKIATGQYVARHMRPFAIAALDYDHERGSRRLRLSRFYWITTGEITNPGGWRGLKERLFAYPATQSRVEVWGARELLWQIYSKGEHDLLAPLERFASERRGEQFENADQGTFAAHCWAAVGQWHSKYTRHDRSKMIEAMDRAIGNVKRDPSRTIFYSRSIQRNIQIWRDILFREDLPFEGPGRSCVFKSSSGGRA